MTSIHPSTSSCFHVPYDSSIIKILLLAPTVLFFSWANVEYTLNFCLYPNSYYIIVGCISHYISHHIPITSQKILQNCLVSASFCLIQSACRHVGECPLMITKNESWLRWIPSITATQRWFGSFKDLWLVSQTWFLILVLFIHMIHIYIYIYNIYIYIYIYIYIHPVMIPVLILCPFCYVLDVLNGFGGSNHHGMLTAMTFIPFIQCARPSACRSTCISTWWYQKTIDLSSVGIKPNGFKFDLLIYLWHLFDLSNQMDPNGGSSALSIYKLMLFIVFHNVPLSIEIPRLLSFDGYV